MALPWANFSHVIGVHANPSLFDFPSSARAEARAKGDEDAIAVLTLCVVWQLLAVLASLTATALIFTPRQVRMVFKFLAILPILGLFPVPLLLMAGAADAADQAAGSGTAASVGGGLLLTLLTAFAALVATGIGAFLPDPDPDPKAPARRPMPQYNPVTGWTHDPVNGRAFHPQTGWVPWQPPPQE
ncbi:MAG: hypothetical protein QM621_11145 [Aeromicrobium sp.]|uniref:hypothetical protein n=1 Tax=Aeromicrobium sp. TaxID=1871063 RepID=UPI0039E44988